MSESREQLLRGRGFGFFGAITASLSHEINNVLATINELSGLLQDFLNAAAGGGAIDVDRLRRPAERIAAQVSRGQLIVKRLNRFAHTVDHTHAHIDLNEATSAIATLCERFATLLRVKLDVLLPDSSPHTEGSVFDLQHVLYRCIDMGLRASQHGDTLWVRLEARANGARVTVRSDSAPREVDDLELRREFLQLLTEELGMSLDSDVRAESPVTITLDIPRVLGSPSPCDPEHGSD